MEHGEGYPVTSPELDRSLYIIYITSTDKRTFMKFFKTLLVIGMLVFFVSGIVFGQPGLPDPPDQTPIDGGLGILAALGGSYAIKKLRDKKGK